MRGNTSAINPVLVCRQVEDLFVKPKGSGGSKPETRPQPITINTDALKPLEGWYRNTETGAGIQLTAFSGGFVSNTGDTMRALNPNISSGRDNLVKFSPTAKNAAMLIANTVYADSAWYEKIGALRTIITQQKITRVLTTPMN